MSWKLVITFVVCTGPKFDDVLASCWRVAEQSWPNHAEMTSAEHSVKGRHSCAQCHESLRTWIFQLCAEVRQSMRFIAMQTRCCETLVLLRWGDLYWALCRCRPESLCHWLIASVGTAIRSLISAHVLSLILGGNKQEGDQNDVRSVLAVDSDRSARINAVYSVHHALTRARMYAAWHVDLPAGWRPGWCAIYRNDWLW